jgi:hypothetical protein
MLKARIVTASARRNVVNLKKYRSSSSSHGNDASTNPRTSLRTSITQILLQSDVVSVQYSNDIIKPLSNIYESTKTYRLYSKHTPYLNQRDLSQYPCTKALREIYEESEGERLKKYVCDIESDVIGCLYDYPECFVIVVGYNANIMTEFFIAQTPF